MFNNDIQCSIWWFKGNIKQNLDKSKYEFKSESGQDIKKDMNLSGWRDDISLFTDAIILSIFFKRANK